MSRLLRLLVLALVACGGGSLPVRPTSQDELVVPTTVPNGRVEVKLRHTYAAGETVRMTIRLIPSSGTLRGPIDPLIQAGGFRGTATVKRLSVTPATAAAGATASVDALWDLRDDAGKTVVADDYSLVFSVADDAGRSTTVGATITVR